MILLEEPLPDLPGKRQRMFSKATGPSGVGAVKESVERVQPEVARVCLIQERCLAMAGEPEWRGPKETALAVSERASAPEKGLAAARLGVGVRKAWVSRARAGRTGASGCRVDMKILVYLLRRGEY